MVYYTIRSLVYKYSIIRKIKLNFQVNDDKNKKLQNLHLDHDDIIESLCANRSFQVIYITK